jgi:hypothetical protein
MIRLKAAPPFDCYACARRIRESGGHYLLADNRVVCVRCIEHRRDLRDALRASGTRAGIAHVLGLWP